MVLNFDRLNSLACTGGLEGTQSEGMVTDRTVQKEQQHKAYHERIGIEERQAEVYRVYQDNIKRSEKLQTDILRGASMGEDIYSLFLKAVQTISSMTGNEAFYSQIDRDIKVIYGGVLQERGPLRIEMQQAQQRLDKLKESEKTQTDTRSLQRIRSAINAHERKIEELMVSTAGQQ